MVQAGDGPFYSWHEKKGKNRSKRESGKLTGVEETGRCHQNLFLALRTHMDRLRISLLVIWPHDHILANGI